MGSSASALTALQTSSYLLKLDMINRDFINQANTRATSGYWSWMEAVTNFQTKNKTTLGADIAAGAVTFTVASDIGFDTTSGQVYFRNSNNAVNFVNYGTFAGTTASTVTNVNLAFTLGTEINKCYALPSNCAKIFRLMVNMQYFTYKPETIDPFYRTYYTRNAFIVLPRSIGLNDATLWYEKSPTNLNTGISTTDLATSMDIPIDFMGYAIHKLAAYILQTRRRSELAQVHDQQAELVIDNALAYDSNRVVPIQGLQSDW